MPLSFSLHLMILGRTQDFLCPITNQPLFMVKKKNQKQLYFAHLLVGLALIFSTFSKHSASLTYQPAEADEAAAGPCCQRAGW